MVENTETLDTSRVMLTAVMPLNEILVDFNDRMKADSWLWFMDYEHSEYQVAKLVKMDIRINEEPVDAFSSIVKRIRHKHMEENYALN